MAQHRLTDSIRLAGGANQEQENFNFKDLPDLKNRRSNGRFCLRRMRFDGLTCLGVAFPRHGRRVTPELL